MPSLALLVVGCDSYRVQKHPQEILDSTIKHSPGGGPSTAMETRPAAAATTRGSAAPAVATGSAALLLSPQETSVETLSTEQQRDDATAPSEATAASDRAEEGDGDRRDEDEDKMALAMATAAAAEELAAAESHSLTQGAMKLVYLLAIQV